MIYYDYKIELKCQNHAIFLDAYIAQINCYMKILNTVLNSAQEKIEKLYILIWVTDNNFTKFGVSNILHILKNHISRTAFL